MAKNPQELVSKLITAEPTPNPQKKVNPLRGATFGNSKDATYPFFAYDLVSGRSKPRNPKEEKWLTDNQQLAKNYQDYQNGFNSSWDEFYASPEYKNRLLDFYFGDDDSNDKFQDDIINMFVNKYPYEKEDIHKGLIRYPRKGGTFGFSVGGRGDDFNERDISAYFQNKYKPKMDVNTVRDKFKNYANSLPGDGFGKVLTDINDENIQELIDLLGLGE